MKIKILRWDEELGTRGSDSEFEDPMLNNSKDWLGDKTEDRGDEEWQWAVV